MRLKERDFSHLESGENLNLVNELNGNGAVLFRLADLMESNIDELAALERSASR